MTCEICGLNPAIHGNVIYRINRGEMPSRWRCADHLTNEQANAVDPIVADISKIIAGSPPPVVGPRQDED